MTNGSFDEIYTIFVLENSKQRVTIFLQPLNIQKVQNSLSIYGNTVPILWIAIEFGKRRK